MAGKLFEELLVGQTFQHQPGRTITESDNVFFTCLTMNPQPLHLDFHAAQKAEFGKPLVNSLLTLGIAVGLSVGETTLGTTVGNLGFEKVEFPKPVFHGDTIYGETTVLDKWVGNTEKAVSMVFNAARKHAPSIIFLDEVEAIGGSRANMQSGWEKKLISQLLIELDTLSSSGQQVMVLGASNAPWDVDFALRRPGRLGRLVFVPPPGPTERAEMKFESAPAVVDRLLWTKDH